MKWHGSSVRGKQVGLLMLFDANSPAYIRGFKGWWNFPIRLDFLFKKWFYYLTKTRNMPLRRAWRYFREQTRSSRCGPRDAAEAGASLRGGGAGAAAYVVVANAVSRRGELRA